MSDPVQPIDQPSTNNPSPARDEEGISILDMLIVLAKHKKVLFGLPLVAGILGYGNSLMMTDIYTSTTSLLAPQGQSSSSMLAQQLGSLVGLAGGALKTPNDLYIGMLQSRTVADNLIERFNLNDGQKYQTVARLVLAGRTKIVSRKDGILVIEVDDADPKRAAEIANAYVEELFKLTKVLAVTDASQRRVFFEHQLAEAKDNLAAAESAAKQALETGGLVQVEGQGRTAIDASGRLRGQITVKEVQIGAMRTFAADRNPELLHAQQELEVMKRELSKIEGSSSNGPVKASKGNTGNMETMNLLRNVKYFETMYELLAKQYEIAKIEEAKDPSVVQVLDKAIVPDLKSKPSRRNITFISALVGGFVAILWAFAMHALDNAKRNPETTARLAQLKRHLWIQRGPAP